MILNITNTNSVANHKVTHPPLFMGGMIVKEKEQLEALGFTIDPRGNWSLHAEAVAKEARKRLGAIRRIAHILGGGRGLSRKS